MGKFYEYEKPNESLNGNERTVIEKEGVTYSVMLKEIIEGLIQGVYLQDLLSEEIDTLENVTITGPTNQQVLTYKDGYWVNDDVGTAQVADIGDVTLTEVVDGHVLTYDNGGWINAPAITSLSSLTDVTISGGLASSHVLRYNGTKWVNTTISLDSLSNVDVTGVADNHVLKRSGSNWVTSVVPNIFDQSLNTTDWPSFDGFYATGSGAEFRGDEASILFQGNTGTELSNTGYKNYYIMLNPIWWGIDNTGTDLESMLSITSFVDSDGAGTSGCDVTLRTRDFRVGADVMNELVINTTESELGFAAHSSAIDAQENEKHYLIRMKPCWATADVPANHASFEFDTTTTLGNTTRVFQVMNNTVPVFYVRGDGKIVGDGSMLTNTGGIAAAVNLTGASSDYLLTVGQCAYITYSAVTSVLLRVQTQEGVYAVRIIGDDNNNPSASGNANILPNNTSYPAEVTTSGAYNSAGGSAAYVAGTADKLSVGWNKVYTAELICHTFIGKKRMQVVSSVTGTSTQVAYRYLLVGYNIWNDTDTPWTSLGTLDFGTQSQSGMVVIQRIM